MIAFKTARLVIMSRLTDNVMEFGFDSGRSPDFCPGQFVNIRINDGKPGMCWRAYSVMSLESGVFKLVIKILENGRGSHFMANLKLGDEVEYIGPVGNFKLHQNNLDANRKIAFIATGTGIVPFFSYLQSVVVNQLPGKYFLLWGLKDLSEVFYVNILDCYAAQLPYFSYNICLSRENNGNFLAGRVSANVDKIENFDEYYLCGNCSMIEDIREFLAQRNKKHVYFEKFD